MIHGTCFNCVLKMYFCLKYWVEKLPLNIEGVRDSGGSCGLPWPCDMGPGEARQQLWALGISFQHFVPFLVQ